MQTFNLRRYIEALDLKTADPTPLEALAKQALSLAKAITSMKEGDAPQAYLAATTEATMLDLMKNLGGIGTYDIPPGVTIAEGIRRSLHTCWYCREFLDENPHAAWSIPHGRLPKSVTGEGWRWPRVVALASKPLGEHHPDAEQRLSAIRYLYALRWRAGAWSREELRTKCEGAGVTIASVHMAGKNRVDDTLVQIMRERIEKRSTAPAGTEPLATPTSPPRPAPRDRPMTPDEIVGRMPLSNAQLRKDAGIREKPCYTPQNAMGRLSTREDLERKITDMAYRGYANAGIAAELGLALTHKLLPSEVNDERLDRMARVARRAIHRGVRADTFMQTHGMSAKHMRRILHRLVTRYGVRIPQDWRRAAQSRDGRRERRHKRIAERTSHASL